MEDDIPSRATELLLSAVFPVGQKDGLVASFGFSRPGTKPMGFVGSMAMEISYGRRELIRAALFVRDQGPDYLRYLPVSDIWSMLQDVVTENFWYISDGQFGLSFSNPETSYAVNTSSQQKLSFAAAFAKSKVFAPANEVTLLPLIPIQTSLDFISDRFFLVQPSSLELALSRLGLWSAEIDPNHFPPFRSFAGRRHIPSTWLGIVSPHVNAAKKMATEILGAIALTPLQRHRYSFSGRSLFDGMSTVRKGSVSISDWSPLTPPLMEDICLNADDEVWLTVLAKLMASTEKPARRKSHALEYFHRAWPLDPTDRFPALCMVLEALYGDVQKATQSIIDGVRALNGHSVDEKRLRLLMQLRGSVVHGRAPNVADAVEYAKYYVDYETDPTDDLELVTALCLRSAIFEISLREQPDPHAQLIAQLQSTGRLPKKSVEARTILNS